MSPRPSRNSSPKAANVAAVLLAGGSGARMRGTVSDKTLAPLAGKPAFRHSASAFAASGAVDTCVIVYRDEAQRTTLEPLAADLPQPLVWAQGGAQRQDSVLAGLRALPATTEIVLIHDCARPLVAPAAIRASVDAARSGSLACVARPVTDTIKLVEPRADGQFLLRSLDRSRLWAMETPQTFAFPLILAAYERVAASGRIITDDLSALEDSGLPTVFIDNGAPNPKITGPSDLAYIEYLIANASASNLTR